LIRHHYFDDSFQQIYAAAKRWPLAIEVARALTALLPDNEQAWTNYANSLYFAGWF
jgi:predicted Zn-dependent protease